MHSQVSFISGVENASVGWTRIILDFLLNIAIFSNGNLAIIASLAAAVVITVIVIIMIKKKRKTA